MAACSQNCSSRIQWPRHRPEAGGQGHDTVGLRWCVPSVLAVDTDLIVNIHHDQHVHNAGDAEAASLRMGLQNKPVVRLSSCLV